MAVEKALISAAVDILSSVVGCIGNKGYDWATGKLKDSDLTNEEPGQALVRDLREIKTKLDSLSLKYLDASCSFLKEGVLFLIIALDKRSEDQETREGPDEATDISTDSLSVFLKAVLTLPRAIQKLQITSKRRLQEAKKSFQKAREYAARTFNNKSLSIKDRIMAFKIRVSARILEFGLEDTEAAVSACLFGLEELHGLPAIKDIFEVFLGGGGMKSWFNKAERLENIMSVLFVNHALFDFAAKSTSKYPNVFTWPRIELADRTFHPILHAYDIVKKTSSCEEFGQQLNRMIVDWRISGHTLYFAINSRGEIILLDDNKITVVYSSGESKDVMFSDQSESNVVKRERRALAVDSDDNVYVVRYLKTSDKNGEKDDVVLCVLDENFNIKHDSILLDYLNVGKFTHVEIAVDKNKNIIMITCENNQVYVCDNTGKLKFKFQRDGGNVWALGISDQNDIMIPSDDRSGVLVYTAGGKLKSTIKVPEDHEVWGVEFFHGICKIIVLTGDRKRGSWSLLCYSETGALDNLERDLPFFGITSHVSGTFAVLEDESVTLI